ncbi:ABC transporter ATP-binding protein [Paenactinomyces guangxiensis]|uniref:ABC transporter ATP-binding protein n=1 Tax=Paenactinomyces guangxiensis TaxID=1490290 RepID=A0A7W2A9V8_9BACL|nr:ABC transporter ATP-binding protein [Paenactinomyces guangxiensis]MBA4496145.1 ABC transporter ATP-binding protein [Paenactinomyces guangxiensis]MBH8593233.1 ABC transporter ATP-binding protein [Paenactinomyces guangxiensis]
MLCVKNLTGGYSVHQPVIHHISFEVQPSEIVGLIGLNGAGKSTTIKHILGLLSPQEGTVTLGGKTLAEDPVHFRSQVAFIPEAPQFYEELTLWEHMELTARAYQMKPDVFKKRAEHLLEVFRMKKVAKWFPNTFSKGMQQKIMILSAFLVQPSLLIVDEPFVGLDPLAIQALLEMLQDGKQQGMAILMSTHILGMAEKYCDRFVILHEGRTSLHGTLPEMRKQAEQPDASLEELFIGVARG